MSEFVSRGELDTFRGECNRRHDQIDKAFERVCGKVDGVSSQITTLSSTLQEMTLTRRVQEEARKTPWAYWLLVVLLIVTVGAISPEGVKALTPLVKGLMP